MKKMIGLLVMLITASRWVMACDCSDISDPAPAGSTPRVETIERVFACAGVSEQVAKLDQADRDLLFLAARQNTETRFFARQTTGMPNVKYADLLTPAGFYRLKGFAMSVKQR